MPEGTGDLGPGGPATGVDLGLAKGTGGFGLGRFGSGRRCVAGSTDDTGGMAEGTGSFGRCVAGSADDMGGMAEGTGSFRPPTGVGLGRFGSWGRCVPEIAVNGGGMGWASTRGETGMGVGRISRRPSGYCWLKSSNVVRTSDQN